MTRVAVFKGVADTSQPRIIDISNVWNECRSVSLQETTAKARQALADRLPPVGTWADRLARAKDGNSGYDNAKRSLPAVILQLEPETSPNLTKTGKATWRPKVNTDTPLTGFCQIDVDGVAPEDIESVKAYLMGKRYVVGVADTASGFGVWALCAIAAKTQDEYKALYPELVKDYDSGAQYHCDSVTNDTTRLRFLAYDPAPRVKTNWEAFTSSTVKTSPDIFRPTYSLYSAWHRKLEGFCAKYDRHAATMGRHDFEYDLFCAGLKAKPPMPQEYMTQAIKSAYQAHGYDDMTLYTDIARQYENAVETMRAAKAALKDNSDDPAMVAHAQMAEWYFDEVHEAFIKIEDYQPLNYDFRYLEHKDYDTMVASLIDPSKKVTKRIADEAVFKRANDPASIFDGYRQRVLSLAARPKPEINPFTQFARVNTFDYYEQTRLQKWLTGVCAKAIDDRVQAQNMLIFFDDHVQGLNKSKFVSSICLALEGQNVDINYTLGEEGAAKDNAVKKVKHLILSIEECENMDKKDSATLKKEITSQAISVRPAYKKAEVRKQSRASFAGITNQPMMLNASDEKGRRYWLIEVKKPLAVSDDQVEELLTWCAHEAKDFFDSADGNKYATAYGNTFDILPPWADNPAEQAETVRRNAGHKSEDSIAIAITNGLHWLWKYGDDIAIRSTMLQTFATWLSRGGELPATGCLTRGACLLFDNYTGFGPNPTAKAIFERLTVTLKAKDVKSIPKRSDADGSQQRCYSIVDIRRAFDVTDGGDVKTQVEFFDGATGEVRQVETDA